MSGLEKGGLFVLYSLLLLHNTSFATPVVNIGKEVSAQKLPRVTYPISYDIKIIPTSIDDYDSTFHGESKITVRILEETRNVTLHSSQLWIDENFTSLVDANGIVHKAKKHSFVNETRFLIIEFFQPISVGIYTLNLNYTGTIDYEGMRWRWKYPNRYGVLRRKDAHKEYLKMSLNPSEARTAFPCWDELDYKATFNLSIKHHPNLTAVSITPVHQLISDPDGDVWTKFVTTPPIPIYRLSFVLSKLTCLQSDDNKFDFCVRKECSPNLKFFLDTTQRAIPILERYIGVPYAVKTKNKSMTLDPKYETRVSTIRGPIKYMVSDIETGNMLLAMERAALTVVRKVAYELLFDLMNVTSSNSSWVVEGLSGYLGYIVVDKLNPGWREMDSFAMAIQLNGFSASNVPIRGAALFHMMSNFVPVDVFMNGIQELMQKTSRRSITSDDLLDAMQLAYDKNEKKRKIDVAIKEAMQSWTNQTGYPILKVTRDYESGKVTITQEGYPFKSNRFWIPITFATKSNPNFTRTTGFWLDPRIDKYVIDDYVDKDDWIIFNIQQSGHYRVDYDETNWNRIAEYMNTKNYKKIHVQNRAQLFNDLAFMVQNGIQNVTTFFNLARYLIREDDFTPWFPVVKYVEWLRTKTFGWPIDKHVTKFFLGLMEKVIRNIDFKDKGEYFEVWNNDNKIRRYYKTLPKNQDFFTKRYGFSMKFFACSIGYPSCLESESDKISNSDQAGEVIKPPGRFPSLFCDAANNETEDSLLKGMKDPHDWECIKKLYCSSNKKALWDFIKKTLTGQLNPPLFQMDMALFHFIYQSDDEKDNNVNIILKNADAIYRYYEKQQYNADDVFMGVKTLMLRCFRLASTPEQLTEILELAAKNPQMISPSRIEKEEIEWKTKSFQWQKDNFPVIRKWLQNHPINNKPVA